MSMGLWCAVFQFGEVDIDGSLVADQLAGSEDVVILNNGCLCCTVRGDLVRMLSDLIRNKRDKFDHIVIETTGVLAYNSSTLCIEQWVVRIVAGSGSSWDFLLWNKAAAEDSSVVSPRLAPEVVTPQL